MDVPDVEIDEAEEEISGEGEAVGDGDEQQSVNFSDPDFDSSEVNFENIQPNFNCNLNWRMWCGSAQTLKTLKGWKKAHRPTYFKWVE